jgi:hypothetical protein
LFLACVDVFQAVQQHLCVSHFAFA